MARKMGDWGLVDASARVDVHRVDDLVSRLCILVRLVLVLVLARGCKE